MEPVREKNRTCNCSIAQPRPGHYVEACRCEFDANLTQRRKTCCRRTRVQCCENKDPVEKLLEVCAEDRRQCCQPAREQTCEQPLPQVCYQQAPQPPTQQPPAQQAPPQQPIAQQPPPQPCCSQQTCCSQQQAHVSPCGCVEDPYAAMGNCVQLCMNEKGPLAQACGVKCPPPPPPPPPPAKEKGKKKKKGDKKKKTKTAK